MTIEEYWGVAEKPFLNTPDIKFLFESEDFIEAMGRILYNLQEIKGGITEIIGEIGCGKTILVHCLLKELSQPHYQPISLINPRLSPTQLLSNIGAGFGIETLPRYRNKILRRLYDFLLEKNRSKITPVLLIDEAQTIPTKSLEEIRLLLNFEDPKKKLLQIVLLGQPELAKRVKGIEQLNQRINIKYHLRGLNQKETHQYIKRRLEVAGASRNIFSDKVIPQIYKFSRGIPRIINTIATNSMYAAYLLKKKEIDKGIIEDVYKEFVE
jgi:general secretion pathway protein A